MSGRGDGGGLCERVRRGARAVVERAGSVRIDDAALASLADAFAAAPQPVGPPDPAHHFRGAPADTLAFVLTLDAVNFGSGWFPELRKRPGLSGYFTIATALKEHFEREGPMRAEQLARIAPEDCAKLFGQDLAGGAGELMNHFAGAWNELGGFLLTRYGGRFAGPLAEADGDAEGIAALLGGLPHYRDVARYDELEVPFFKRAQITVADLAAADIGEQGERIHGVERLTSFADNLVPHVLRMEGVLHYAAPLAELVDGEALVPPGSPFEVEIRAAGVECVERMVARLGEAGVPCHAASLDAWLWQRGQSPAIKARPRHRTRTLFY